MTVEAESSGDYRFRCFVLANNVIPLTNTRVRVVLLSRTKVTQATDNSMAPPALCVTGINQGTHSAECMVGHREHWLAHFGKTQSDVSWNFRD